MPPDLPSVFIPCMPDGTPAPHVMTQAELIQFLRLENRFPGTSVERMRKTQGLRSVQVGKCVRYLLPDVVQFLATRQQENPR